MVLAIRERVDRSKFSPLQACMLKEEKPHLVSSDILVISFMQTTPLLPEGTRVVSGFSQEDIGSKIADAKSVIIVTDVVNPDKGIRRTERSLQLTLSGPMALNTMHLIVEHFPDKSVALVADSGSTQDTLALSDRKGHIITGQGGEIEIQAYFRGDKGVKLPEYPYIFDLQLSSFILRTSTSRRNQERQVGKTQPDTFVISSNTDALSERFPDAFATTQGIDNGRGKLVIIPSLPPKPNIDELRTAAVQITSQINSVFESLDSIQRRKFNLFIDMPTFKTSLQLLQFIMEHTQNYPWARRWRELADHNVFIGGIAPDGSRSVVQHSVDYFAKPPTDGLLTLPEELYH